MKTLILTLALLALIAGSAMAQVDETIKTVDNTVGTVGTTVNTLTPDWYHRNHDPVQPVPEPGTMALASMGLIALGAAARKRRNNSK